MEREKRREREWNENQLEGRNAVLEVLRSGRDIEKIMVQKGNVEGTIKRIVAQAAGGKPPEAGRAFPDKEPSGRDRAGFRA